MDLNSAKKTPIYHLRITSIDRVDKYIVLSQLETNLNVKRRKEGELNAVGFFQLCQNLCNGWPLRGISLYRPYSYYGCLSHAFHIKSSLYVFVHYFKCSCLQVGLRLQFILQ